MADAALASVNVVTDVDALPSDPMVAATIRFLFDLRDRLPMFVVYDHPADFPDHYVARLWVSHPPTPIRFVLRAMTLAALQDTLDALGLVHLMRHEADDPAVVETWV